MRNTAYPRIAHLGKVPDEQGDLFEDVARNPDALQLPGVSILRMDASLYFVNATHFRETVKQALSGEFHTVRDTRIEILIVDASPWSAIDYTGIQVLTEVMVELPNKQLLHLACCKSMIRDKLQATNLAETVGIGGLYLFSNSSVGDAVRICERYVEGQENSNLHCDSPVPVGAEDDHVELTSSSSEMTTAVKRKSSFVIDRVRQGLGYVVTGISSSNGSGSNAYSTLHHHPCDEEIHHAGAGAGAATGAATDAVPLQVLRSFDSDRNRSLQDSDHDNGQITEVRSVDSPFQESSIV